MFKYSKPTEFIGQRWRYQGQRCRSGRALYEDSFIVYCLLPYVVRRSSKPRDVVLLCGTVLANAVVLFIALALTLESFALQLSLQVCFVSRCCNFSPSFSNAPQCWCHVLFPVRGVPERSAYQPRSQLYFLLCFSRRGTSCRWDITTMLCWDFRITSVRRKRKCLARDSETSTRSGVIVA